MSTATRNRDRVLHKSDCRTFDPDSWKLIRTMQQHGWRGHISARGHAIMRAPDGVTTSAVSRKHSSHGRNQQNAWAEFRRWLAAQETEETVATIETTPEVEVADERITCTEPGCDWSTSGLNSFPRLRAHIASTHRGPYICECGEVFATASGLGGHRNVHRGKIREPAGPVLRERTAETYAWLTLQDAPVSTLDLARAMFADYDESDQVDVLRKRRQALRILQRLQAEGRVREVVKGVPGRSGTWEAVVRVRDDDAATPVPPPPAEEEETAEPSHDADVIDLHQPAADLHPDVKDAEDALAAIRSIVSPELVRENETLRLVLADLRAAHDAVVAELDEHRTRIALMRETLGL